MDVTSVLSKVSKMLTRSTDARKVAEPYGDIGNVRPHLLGAEATLAVGVELIREVRELRAAVERLGAALEPQPMRPPRRRRGRGGDAGQS